MNNKVEVTKQQECIHHWIIEPARAPTSYGKCKRCGMVTELYNTFTNDLVCRVKVPDKALIQPVPSS